MARRPKPENANNPLRKLRESLAWDGVPMTQLALSKTIGIPLDTIKSTEAGRIAGGMPGESVRVAIDVHLGTHWDAEEQKWSFLFTGAPPTWEDAQRYRKAPLDRRTEIHALCLRMISLLQTVSTKDFAILADTIDNSLLRLAEEYTVNARGDFSSASLELHPIWRDGAETDDVSNIVGYERKREGWMWEEKDGKWKKRNRKSKLFDFRDKLKGTDPS